MAKLRLRARTVEEISNRQLMPFEQEIKQTLYEKGAMVLELVEDSETTVSLVTLDNLDAMQLDKAQALKMASAAMIRETGANQWKAIGQLWYSTYSDDYDFARLIAAGEDAHLPFSNGTAVAYAPSHAVCVVSNQPTATNLEHMIELGGKLSENQRMLSNRIWTRDKSGLWTHYRDDTNQEVAHVLKRQTVIEDTNNYSEQKELIDKIYETQQIDVFVASYVGMQNKEGEIVTMCTYTLDLPTLLPETELVNVYDHEAERVSCTLPWKDFATIMGSSMKKLDLYIPSRYSLTDTLSATQLSSLKNSK